jgi:hypothetical protein
MAVAIKLTPIVLVIWLAGSHRWRAIGAVVATGLALLLVSVLGAGIDSLTAWLASATTAAPSPSSFATLLGVSQAFVVGLFSLPVLLLWGRHRASFSAAIVASALMTPALYFSAFALLAAAIAPRVHRTSAADKQSTVDLR